MPDRGGRTCSGCTLVGLCAWPQDSIPWYQHWVAGFASTDWFARHAFRFRAPTLDIRPSSIDLPREKDEGDDSNSEEKENDLILAPFLAFFPLPVFFRLILTPKNSELFIFTGERREKSPTSLQAFSGGFNLCERCGSTLALFCFIFVTSRRVGAKRRCSLLSQYSLWPSMTAALFWFLSLSSPV